MTIFLFIVSIPLGVWLIVKTDWFVGTFGRISWAERNLGGGGSYTMYKLIGLASIIFGFMLITGLFQALLNAILGVFFGGFREEG